MLSFLLNVYLLNDYKQILVINIIIYFDEEPQESHITRHKKLPLVKKLSGYVKMGDGYTRLKHAKWCLEEKTP